MINRLSIPQPQLIKTGLLLKSRTLLVFCFFNALALIRLASLQLRPLLTDSSNDRFIWSLITLFVSYNVWAVMGSTLLYLDSQRKLKLIQYLLFFGITTFSYNLVTALIYQMSLGFPLEFQAVSRSMVLNSTGLVHINILFMLSILVIRNWFKIPNHDIEEKEKETITLKNGSSVESLLLNEIIFIKAEQNYVSVKLEGMDQPKLFRHKIGSLEKCLGLDKGFIRAHRSHIINLRYLTGLSMAENGIDMQCHLNRSDVLPVSRKKKQELRALI